MFAERRIWESARCMMQDHAYGAAEESALMARHAAEIGDMDGLYFWGQVTRAILAFQVPVPGSGEAVH